MASTSSPFPDISVDPVRVGKSASTATAVKPFSLINRLVIWARSRRIRGCRGKPLQQNEMRVSNQIQQGS